MRRNWPLFINELEKPSEVVLQVAHVQEIIDQQLRASNSNRDNDGTPFIEYSSAPDNIEEENGVRVFAGYQVKEKVVVIE